MMREVIKSKIHRLMVTDSDLNYQTSITIDEDLMDKADMLENEKIYIVNVTNGNRFDSYVVKGVRGSGVICVNGSTAHLAKKDDIIIILTYYSIADERIKNHKTNIIFVDMQNRVVNNV